jgi:hypothetical protein
MAGPPARQIRMHGLQDTKRTFRNIASLIIAMFALSMLLPFSPSFAEEDIPLMKLEEVTDLIMSPGCNYLYTLTLCPSAEADQMRKIVKDKLRSGETKEEILAYLEGIYGPKVLARPARRGFYSFAWWFPYFLIIDIFIVVAVLLYVWRRRARKQEAMGGGIPAGSGQGFGGEEDDLLEEEVRRFRELEP